MKTFIGALLCVAAVSCAHGQTVRRVSVSASGVQGNDNSYAAGWHPSGCCVVFYTRATNLFVTPDPNAATTVAMVNLATRAVTDLTRGKKTGLTGTNTFLNLFCETRPIFSADGKTLAFYGEKANGFVAGDTSSYIWRFSLRTWWPEPTAA